MKINKLNIKDELVADIRVFKAPVLARQILKYNQEKELIVLALDKDQLLSSRAMWVLGHCSDIDYNRVKPFFNILIDNLKHPNLHNGVIRNTLRLFQKHTVPKKQESFLLDKCFEYIKNPTEAIAVRAFAMTVIFNISKPYPELLDELLMILNDLSIHDNGPGIRSRLKNILKDIHKLKRK
jgi:hypothetical protein